MCDTLTEYNETKQIGPKRMRIPREEDDNGYDSEERKKNTFRKEWEEETKSKHTKCIAT